MLSRFLTIGLAVTLACGPRAEAPGASASPTAASAATITATASPAPTPSATPTLKPNPTAGPGTYTSLAYGYRVDLPAGWRRSACQSTRDPSQPPAVETFTSASIDEETGTDIGPAHDIVFMQIEENPSGQTALGWLESGKLGFSTQSHFEKITFDNNPDAARMVGNDGTTIGAIVVNARFRIYAISRGLREPTPASEATARAIMSSLHILRDAELADARSTLATPPPPAPRSAEEVADALARGFSQRDMSILATVADACITRGAEQAGASFNSTPKILAEWQKSFANGFSVTVQPRPIEYGSGPSSPGATVRATWLDPGQPQRNVQLMMTKVRDTWYWIGVLYLQH